MYIYFRYRLSGWVFEAIVIDVFRLSINKHTVSIQACFYHSRAHRGPFLSFLLWFIYISLSLAAIHLLSVVDVTYCYGDISITTIVIHSLLLFILSSPDHLFIYLCRPFHSSPHVFLIMLLFSPLVQPFLLYNYHACSRILDFLCAHQLLHQLYSKRTKTSMSASIMPQPFQKSIANRKKITLTSAV